ncbi:hypothetical protein [Hymenobacter siberiensis]|uniref:hypothetical protein n=1 Tax=Hymenobacter siberiensis TaxID=2848396 RepID=UPI001C1E2943|nr:hypothetical protein [Hymenobacter siberiensis]
MMNIINWPVESQGGAAGPGAIFAKTPKPQNPKTPNAQMPSAEVGLWPDYPIFIRLL